MLPVVFQAAHYRGVSRNKPGEFYDYFHEHHVVGFKVVGSGYYRSGNEERQLRSPYLGVLPAGELDRNGLVGPFDMYWVKFDWKAIERQKSGLTVGVNLFGQHLQRSHSRRLTAAEVRSVLDIFQELLGLARRPDLASRMRAGARVADLVAVWADLPAEAEGEERAARIYRGLIEQYAHDAGVSLAGIAARVGLSADHLAVLFQREVGMSPVEYRTRLRLLRAREMLVSTAQPVGAIAREVGFPDANYFARLFRRKYGMTPRQFARANRMDAGA